MRREEEAEARAERDSPRELRTRASGPEAGTDTKGQPGVAMRAGGGPAGGALGRPPPRAGAPSRPRAERGHGDDEDAGVRRGEHHGGHPDGVAEECGRFLCQGRHYRSH
ncbi:unnamed protein product [Prorocentrum cordatum]|uniref:Uncharacterized protein n=1 Tax=Prorocentrum cordatum TaxID=2364126 RepID=A0ABN9U9J9_9DINO|nr:unnamed protein product [Polarella glacialis]